MTAAGGDARAMASRDAVVMPSGNSAQEIRMSPMSAEQLAQPTADGIDELTVEQASCLAVTAVTADLEYWARTAANGDGRVGLNDLVRILDVIRQDSTPEP
jgi:hypothetical protein